MNANEHEFSRKRTQEPQRFLPLRLERGEGRGEVSKMLFNR